jgi:Holliday junction DNA helicase RuvA
MITRIDGILEQAGEGSVHVRVGDVTYELLVPACDEAEWMSSVGSRVSLHTLHYLESQGQGASFWPRLIGFREPGDRDFFDLFTSVKGIGMRRALRSIAIPPARIAEAIVVRDTALLMSLPEIGKKTAETMVLELRDKVTSFAMRAGELGVAAGAASGGTGSGGTAPSPKGAAAGAKAGPGGRASAKAAASAGAAGAAGPPQPQGPSRAQIIMDASAVLVQLGESRIDARELVDRALQRNPDLATADAIVAAALATRQAST